MAVSGTVPTELGDKRIRDLLMQYAVPAIIAMTASSLYNMVDSIYIGHIEDVGKYAISGLAVTFPFMNLSTALGTLVGVGASTILSMLLGQRNYEASRKVLVNEIVLNVLIGLSFTLVSLAFLDPILGFFGASEMMVNEDFPAPGGAKHRFQVACSCERVAVQTENQVGFSYALTCGITVRWPLKHVFFRCSAEHEGQCLRKRV